MKAAPIKILLQTTIVPTEDDWSIARFSRLADLLARELGADGTPLYEVTARDRGPVTAPDPLLSTLDTSEFDQLWLFAVDVGNGLTPEDCSAISRFRETGGRLMVTRDHMDLGSSICTLGGIGAAHFFHTRNLDPDPATHMRDDPFTTDISWPNFHSGANGDYQEVALVLPVHSVLENPDSAAGVIRYLPAHPHEGGVRAPAGANARVIATGSSKATGRTFNIAVAFEGGPEGGRAIAQSTFHHFADYNWNPADGSPSFVTEAPGNGLKNNPAAMADTHQYVLNVAKWLGRRAASQN